MDCTANMYRIDSLLVMNPNYIKGILVQINLYDMGSIHYG